MPINHRPQRGAGTGAFPQSGRDACSICVRRSFAESDELRRDDGRDKGERDNDGRDDAGRVGGRIPDPVDGRATCTDP
jgi:hypothetical protein